MQVHIIYLNSGAVRVHRAGCRDVARELRGSAGRVTSEYQVDVSTQHEAAEEFHADFLEEGSMTPDEAWTYTTVLPCASELPVGEPGSCASWPGSPAGCTPAMQPGTSGSASPPGRSRAGARPASTRGTCP